MQRSVWTIAVVWMAVAVGAVGPVGATPAWANVAPGETEPVRVGVSRRSLANEYLALERAAVASPAAPERVAEANRVFDRATRHFFRGDYAQAVRAIHRARAIFEGRDPEAMRGEEVLFTLDRLYFAVGDGAPLNIAYRRVYGPPARRGSMEGALSMACERGEVVTHFDSAEDGSVRTVRMVVPDARAGVCRPVASFADTDLRVELPRVRITERALLRVRAELLARLDGVAVGPALARAMATARARVGLLSETPVDSVSATFMLDLSVVAAEAEREVAAIEAGRDPYAGRVGDLWCVFDVGGTGVPLRLIVPEGPAAGPRGLVIAVHGAGGDENLFPDGYGGGVIKDLAERHGVIVASPAAGLMAPMPGYFDALLAAVSAWHEIDPRRVYLIGHSMGGGVVSSWAKARPEQVAGVVSIAGIASFAGAAKLPRVLAVAGELDPLVTWERTQEQARLAREQGLDVEYRRVDGWGHTLVVGRVLPEAFGWLMGERGEGPVGR